MQGNFITVLYANTIPCSQRDIINFDFSFVTPHHVIPSAARDLLSDGRRKIKIMKKTLEKLCGYDQMAA